MSSIYIQEPPTCGKVLFTTSVGEIEVELWSKEAPKACRNFIQLGLEGYYNGTIFHRIVKHFIAQGGDPTGTGMGGESIFGDNFKKEIHTRLRFNRRGLIAVANSENNDNTSQFFFTFAPTPELQNVHTIFGKVVGDTIFNMLKLEEFEVDKNERPLYPPKIYSVEVLNNPFPDIIPRKVTPHSEKKVLVKEKPSSAGVRNFSLLSFGDQAEEDEEELNLASKNFEKTNISSHDLLNDPKLSKISFNDAKESKGLPQDTNKGKKEMKLHTKETTKSYDIKEENVSLSEKPTSEEATKDYFKELEKYSSLKKKIPKSGTLRETQTLGLLESFKKKMNEKIKNEDLVPKDVADEKWKSHTFKCLPGKALLSGKNNKGHDGDSDMYDISDPRNPIVKRRREDKKKHFKNKKFDV